jgi:hypothetical protein
MSSATPPTQNPPRLLSLGAQHADTNKFVLLTPREVRCALYGSDVDDDSLPSLECKRSDEDDADLHSLLATMHVLPGAASTSTGTSDEPKASTPFVRHVLCTDRSSWAASPRFQPVTGIGRFDLCEVCVFHKRMGSPLSSDCDCARTAQQALVAMELTQESTRDKPLHVKLLFRLAHASAALALRLTLVDADWEGSCLLPSETPSLASIVLLLVTLDISETNATRMFLAQHAAVERILREGESVGITQDALVRMSLRCVAIDGVRMLAAVDADDALAAEALAAVQSYAAMEKRFARA